VASDEIEAIEVDILEIKVGADVMVEQGQLDAQLAQRLFDGAVQPPSASPCIPIP